MARAGASRKTPAGLAPAGVEAIALMRRDGGGFAQDSRPLQRGPDCKLTRALRGADRGLSFYRGMNSMPQYSIWPLFGSFLKVTSTAASLAFMFSLSKVFFSYTSTVSPVERVSSRTGLPTEEIASSSVLLATLCWNELRVWP